MFNEVKLIGRTGKDPEIRKMNSGDTVASFSLATTESWKNDQGEKQEKTQWHQVVSFNQGLNKVFEKHVGKGDLLMVTGQLEHRSYEKDGEKKYVTEVVIRPYKGELLLLGSPKGDSDSQGNERQSSNSRRPADELEDEIPFDQRRQSHDGGRRQEAHQQRNRGPEPRR